MGISWTACVRNDEVLHCVKEDGNRNNKKKEGEMMVIFRVGTAF